MGPSEWLGYVPEDLLQHNTLRITTFDLRSGVIPISLRGPSVGALCVGR